MDVGGNVAGWKMSVWRWKQPDWLTYAARQLSS